MVAPAKTALDRVLGGLVNSLSIEAAQTVIESKLDPDTQSMLDRYADKASDGTLTAVEREEYLELVEAIDILSIFQAKVRKAIAKKVAAMKENLRGQVAARASDRCEYCRLPQVAVGATFHVEHVRAKQHGGSDDLDNLAFACDRCNLFKGTNLTSVDPKTGAVVALYNPRQQNWLDHFGQHGYEIIGITDVGRATVRLLKMNAANRVELREELGLILDAEE